MIDSQELELIKQILMEESIRQTEQALAQTPPFKTTAKHRRAMRRIIYGKPSIKKRVAVALLAAVLAALVGCSVYAYKEKIADFIQHIYETYIHVTYNNADDTPTKITKKYLPEYIPEGYEVRDYQEISTLVRTEWSTSENQRIIFSQEVILEKHTVYDSEDSQSTILTINNTNVYYSQYNNFKSYVWHDEKYAYTLKFTADFADEKIAQMITLTPVE